MGQDLLQTVSTDCSGDRVRKVFQITQMLMTKTTSRSSGVDDHKKNVSNANWMEEFSSETSDENESLERNANQDFAEMFEASQKQAEFKEGAVVEGVVLTVGPEMVSVDIGYKCEGFIPTHEFRDASGEAKVQVGDHVSVYLERLELESGQLLLSRDKANIIKAWDEISQACERDELVEGVVISKVKGGLAVDIGVKAFLPGSQLDSKPLKTLDRFIGKRMKFKIIKFNKRRGNIVLSRKAVLAQEQELQRAETLSSLQEGMVVTGTVKNITDYGAFVDLGGVDGLLHVSDIFWGRPRHPSEVLKVNDEISVKILKYDKDKGRVSLGYKQVQPNPWDGVEYKYPIGKKVSGKVVQLQNYGAFVELEDDIEGMIHVSEMSWTERVKHPKQLLQEGQTVECKVLEVDQVNKRIKLGLKQLMDNPWDALEIKFPVGTIIEAAEVKSLTDFGVFVDVGVGIDGLVHVSDLAWTKKTQHPSEKFRKGEKIRVVVLGIDKVNEKFSLGIKQLERDPWENIKSRYRPGQAVDGTVTELTHFGAFVQIEDGIEGLIYISELADHRVDKPSDILKPGTVVRAEILSIEPKERRISLSIRQLNKSEERNQFESYVGEKTKKTSMGDVLGDRLKNVLKGQGTREENE